MTNTLTPDLIRQKRAEAADAIKAAENSILEWRARLNDLDAAERVMALIAGPSAILMTQDDIDGALAKRARAAKAGNPFRVGTNKAFIWQALYEAPEIWLTANEVQDRASMLCGWDIPMSSISPTLSDMKEEYLERNKWKVALKARLNENGEAGASPDEPDLLRRDEHQPTAS